MFKSITDSLFPHRIPRLISFGFLIAFFTFHPGTIRLSHAQASGNTWMVNDLGDSGVAACVVNAGSGGPICQLRDAISKAVNGDTITFSLSGTITINSTFPQITTTLTIDGTGQAVVISGNTNNQVFTLSSSANFTLKSVTVSFGYAANGGGLYNNGGVLDLINTTFSNNATAPNGMGGGIFNNTGGSLTITGGLFQSNSAYRGGGIFNSGTVTTTNVMFKANNTDCEGAGIDSGSPYHNGSVLNVINSSFIQNIGYCAGGAINTYGTLNVIGSTFTLNSENDWGGAIDIDSGGAGNIANSTFVGNTSGGYGGAINGFSSFSVTNSTFYGNSSFDTGADVYSIYGTSTVQNSILTGDSHGGDCAGNLVGSNNLSDGTCPGTSANVTLLDTTLRNNGGLTQTVALLAGSNAIGAVPAPNCIYPPSFTSPIFTPGAGNSIPIDQRGVTRKTACDVGAYETTLIISGPLPNGTANVPYSQALSTSDGNGVYTYILVSGVLPQGLTFNSNGLLDGTPSLGGTFTFRIGVADTAGNTGGQTFSITIDGPTATPTSTATSTPTSTATSTPTSTNTRTPTYTPTNTVTPTNTSALSSTFTPTNTPTPTDTQIATSPATSTSTPTNTNTPTNTSTPTPTLVPPPDGSTLTVDRATDSPAPGTGSGLNGDLRYVISLANECAAACTVQFNLPSSSTIILTYGGLVLNRNVTINGPGVNNLAIDGNHAASIFVVNSNVSATLSGLTIQNGYAIYNGGGIINNGGTILISNCFLSGNAAGSWGGGIVNNGMLTISGCTFANNSTAGSGGGIYNDYSQGRLIISNSTFVDNTGSYGGALYNASTASISNSTFSDNVATNNGGAIYDNAGSLSYNTGATVIVGNSTFSGNLANNGNGGAIFNNYGVVYVGSSILAGSTSQYDFNAADTYGVDSLGHNLVGSAAMSTGWGSSDQVNVANAMLDPLGSYGGPLETIRLQPDSPAIGQGDCNLGSPAEPVTTDERGITRKSPCDGGAYETTLTIGGPLPNGVVGEPYTQTLNASGGNSLYTFSLASGALPPELTLSSVGVLSGTPIWGGTFTFRIGVADSAGNTGGQTFAIVVDGSTATPTNTNSPTATNTATNTATSATTPTTTNTPTNTFTPSSTYSPTATYTATATTNTPTNTPTATPTNTSTPMLPRIDSIGIFRSGTFYLRLHNSTGIADLAVAFNPGTKPYPVVGDWTGVGFDTVGVYDQSNGLFTLCTANNKTTCANTANRIQFVLGNPNDQPISGLWNAAFSHFGGGVFRPSNGLIYLRNNLTSGFADYTMVLGIPGDVGLAGDWNGDGLDSLGVYRPTNSTFYLNDKTCNCSLFGTYQFAYGIGGDAPVVGDWIGQGHDGVGLFRQSNGYTYLRNTLTTGFADIAFVYGIAGDVPVAGHWQLIYSPVPNAGNVLVSPTFVPVPTSGAVSD